MTPPMMPVLLVADSDLQESSISDGAHLRIPKLTLTRPPQGDSGAVAESARMLVAAETPVLIADRTACTYNGMKLLIELAETLRGPVVNHNGRMNFPSRHPLNQTERSGALIANADVILGLEVGDFWGTINSVRDQQQRSSHRFAKADAKLISITAADLFSKSNYQDFQRYPEVDLAIAADSEATLPSLIEAVKHLLTADRKRAFEDRGKKFATARQESLDRSRTEATYAWDASPISTARLSADIWGQSKDKDWSLVSSGSPLPMRLWNFDKYHQYIGGSGGPGVGSGPPPPVAPAPSNPHHPPPSAATQ